MNVSQELKNFSNLTPHKTLLRIVKNPIKFSKEKVNNIIPSISMGSDGPILTNLILLTDNFIIDVRVGSQNEIFDYISINTIINYRLSLSEHIIKTADGKDIVYQVAQIELLHDLAGFKTALSYVGNDRESWLNKVIETMPISLIL